MNAADLEKWDQVARRIRGDIVRLSHEAKTPHLGSSLSCVDILVAAYWGILNIDPAKPNDPDRDRFILSKGHAAMALYSALAHRGFISMDLLNTYSKPGSPLAEHPGWKTIPGVEASTGSLGHGLPIGVGMAVAGQILKKNFQVYVLMSDGECNEGSVWEAALTAPAKKIDHLTVIVDYNKWQATGRSNEVMSLESLVDKWNAFGWAAVEVNGHDLAALVESMKYPSKAGQPRAIIAHTVKGKGVSFMEDDNNWHYRVPTADELKAARTELKLI